MSAPAQPQSGGTSEASKSVRRQPRRHQPYRRTSAVIDERPDGKPIIFGYGRHMTKREKERVQRLVAYGAVGLVAAVSLVIIVVAAVFDNIITPNQSVAWVNGKGISRHDRDLLTGYYTAQNTQITQSGGTSQTDPQAQADTKLEQDLMTRTAAKADFGLTVSDSDAEARLKKDLPNFGGQAGFDNVLTLTGLSKSDYLQFMIKPLVLNEKIGKLLTAGNAATAEMWHYARLEVPTKKAADQALLQLLGKANFATLVKKESLDSVTKAAGGDVGWVRSTDVRIDTQITLLLPTLQAMAKTNSLYRVAAVGTQWYVLKFLGHDLKHPLSALQRQYDVENAYSLWFEKKKAATVFNPPLLNPTGSQQVTQSGSSGAALPSSSSGSTIQLPGNAGNGKVQVQPGAPGSQPKSNSKSKP